jgi:pilus assembly protein TadC
MKNAVYTLLLALFVGVAAGFFRPIAPHQIENKPAAAAALFPRGGAQMTTLSDAGLDNEDIMEDVSISGSRKCGFCMYVYIPHSTLTAVMMNCHVLPKLTMLRLLLSPPLCSFSMAMILGVRVIHFFWLGLSDLSHRTLLLFLFALFCILQDEPGRRTVLLAACKPPPVLVRHMLDGLG